MIDPVPPFWHPSRVRALLLDWDGVLAETHLDFSPLRQRFYGGRRAMLLEDLGDATLEQHLTLHPTEEADWACPLPKIWLR